MSWDFMISGGAINLLTRCVSILGALQSARGGNPWAGIRFMLYCEFSRFVTENSVKPLTR